jgi:HK97 family phage major capsid protein
MSNRRGYSPPTKPTIIGYRKNGSPIWLAVGGAPDELEAVMIRQRELLDLMEAVNKDLAAEGRTDEQRSVDTKTFDDYDAEFKKNEARKTALEGAIKDREAREARVSAARKHYGSFDVQASRESGMDPWNVDYRQIGYSDETTDTAAVWQERASKLLDNPKVQRHLSSEQRSRVDTLLRRKDGDTDGELIAAFLVATSNPHYRSAFQKAASGLAPVFSPEEGRAVREVNYLKRAMSIGADASGGFAVPVVIDPTIILTAQGSDNPVLARARVETITNDEWKGLSSAGVTWKFDAEASAATDNSPTVAQPSVATKRADGFIPFSIEIGQDWPGFAERMAELLGSGYDELLADKLTIGTGANTPTGVIAKLAAITSPAVVKTEVATAGTIATSDIYNMWAALPQRHRRKSSTAWMSSTKTQNAIRQLGTLDPNFTVNLTEEGIGALFGRGYDMNDYMTDFAAGTGTQSWVTVGNWQGYLVAQRAGMNIEFVPMLFDVTNNRPTGQRGWFAWARIGADVVDPTAFRLLTNRSA